VKLVFIAYNEALDDELTAALEGLSIDTYTKWTRVLGKGRTSGPHLGSPVWPKHNNVLAVCVQDDEAQAVLEAVRGLRAEMGRHGIKAFVLPCEEVT